MFNISLNNCLENIFIGQEMQCMQDEKVSHFISKNMHLLKSLKYVFT